MKQCYSDQLKSPKWQKKRLRIFERDNFACSSCGDTETELHVHHKKYSENPIDEPDENLTTLCKHCHQVISWCGKVMSAALKVRKTKGDSGEIFLQFICNEIIYFFTIYNGDLIHNMTLSNSTLLELSEIVKNNCK